MMPTHRGTANHSSYAVTALFRSSGRFSNLLRGRKDQQLWQQPGYQQEKAYSRSRTTADAADSREDVLVVEAPGA